MKSKLNYLIGISLGRKIKTKWFLAANIVLALIIAAVINIDSIISMFGGDFNEQQQIYVIDNTNITYDKTVENSYNIKTDNEYPEESIKKLVKDYDLVPTGTRDAYFKKKSIR